MTDITHWDDMITTAITNVKNLLAKCKNEKTSKQDKLDSLENIEKLFSRLKSLQRSYRTELLNIGNAT